MALRSKKALQKYNSYTIVDNLLATGGKVNCVSKLLETNQKEVAGLLTVVELRKLGGRAKFNFPSGIIVMFLKFIIFTIFRININI